jgi:hypothetical protein
MLSLQDFAAMNEIIEVKRYNEEQAMKYYEAKAKRESKK